MELFPFLTPSQSLLPGELKTVTVRIRGNPEKQVVKWNLRTSSLSICLIMRTPAPRVNYAVDPLHEVAIQLLLTCLWRGIQWQVAEMKQLEIHGRNDKSKNTKMIVTKLKA